MQNNYQCDYTQDHLGNFNNLIKQDASVGVQMPLKSGFLKHRPLPHLAQTLPVAPMPHKPNTYKLPHALPTVYSTFLPKV